jgi:hypothetical protein
LLYESLSGRTTKLFVMGHSNCKYLGIILHNDFSWADEINYTVKEAWKALHFIVCIIK